jgi:hypothetical protein
LIEVAVIEPGKHRLSGRIRSLKGFIGRTDALEAAGLRE